MNLADNEPRLSTALLQFIFPFSLQEGRNRELRDQLLLDGFEPFFLDETRLEDAYYGEGYCISHENMERVYLPFAAHVLFPRAEKEPDAFHRYSRAHILDCEMLMPQRRMPFRLLSTDIFLCPFQLGFVTIRLELTGEYTLSEALEFADRFRSLEDASDADRAVTFSCPSRTFSQTEDLLFGILAPHLRDYLDQSEMSGAYFETLPFFVDERMLVQGFYGFEPDAEITETVLYRISQIDGLNGTDRPYISASDPEYIQDYNRKHTYRRWAPDTYYITNEQTFSCVSCREGESAVRMANQMYGEYYYGLLLSLFHKIVLLKLANIHSRLRIEHDYEEIESLIFDINRFSAKFYFLELISQSQGREIFFQLRKVYGNDQLYDEVKGTLDDLFQYQEKFQGRRRDNLLMILTVFTVISGIYGMNQVIEDLKSPIHWDKMLGYSPFEYLALFVTMTGIAASLVLAVREVWNQIRRKRRQKYRFRE
ncbi:hypothetical protein [Paenibacillus glufosinatiresistens]|uniref:hypothetical protein n=1 Tax=Paenibacillus glufosinatiresistens TaxID=3070657 RepID=UPI00286E4DC7|nr:hypothetical protein [Paenibacillus sp. YX.27]